MKRGLSKDKDKGGNAMKESVDMKHLKKQTKISSFLPIYIEVKDIIVYTVIFSFSF